MEMTTEISVAQSQTLPAYVQDELANYEQQIRKYRAGEVDETKMQKLRLHFSKGMRAWVTAIRRDQSPARAGTNPIERDERFGLVKINPLAAWSARDVWNYIAKHDVPYNRLHDQGYSSIGCMPCTTPVQIGEMPRAGRWRGTGKSECGIHERVNDPVVSCQLSVVRCALNLELCSLYFELCTLQRNDHYQNHAQEKEPRTKYKEPSTKKYEDERGYRAHIRRRFHLRKRRTVQA